MTTVMIYVSCASTGDFGTQYVTRSDKRVTKCQSGQSELSMPTESAIKELSVDVSFKTVHDAKVTSWPLRVRW